MIYLTTDKPIYRVGDKAIIIIHALNEDDHVITLSIRITATLENEKILDHEEKVALIGGERKIMEIQTDLKRGGVLMVNADINYDGRSVSDNVRAYVIDVAKRIQLALVYHMHQPPWYLPSGDYYMDWAFRYIVDNSLAPTFNGGPYAFHAYLNEKHKEVKTTVNLSPSLLKQWSDAIERGYRLMDGHQYGKDSDQVKKIADTLELFKSQVHRGQVEALTSLYAHTIAGYLVATHGMRDIVDEEVRTGADVTRSILGIEPQGIWTPEMAWDMSLLDIYVNAGLKYTVLCGKNHFPGSVGDKGSIYEPYKLGGFTIFFRDQRISDILAFENNLFDDRHADRMARRIIMDAFRVDGLNPLVVIALDGENFIAMSKTPRLVAVELDILYTYLEKLQRDGIITTVKLSEAMTGGRTLTYIPTTSWLGGFSKWRGERVEHDKYWIKAVDTYRFILGAEAMLGTKLVTARNAMWHALDSDYWWSDYWSNFMIDEWLSKARNEAGNSMEKIHASLINDVIETIINRETRIGIRVTNETGSNIKLDVVCCRDSSSHVLTPGEATIEAVVMPTVAGQYKIPIIISSRNYGYWILYQTLIVKAFP